MPPDPWPQVEQALRERLFQMAVPPPVAAAVILSLHHVFCALSTERGERGPDEFGVVLQAAVDALT